MFRHVVLFQWTASATAAQRAAVRDGLRALPARVPAIRALSVGADAGLAPDNFDCAAIVDFDGEADYLVYREHPAHQRLIAELIAPILARRVRLQYDTGEGHAER